MNNVYIVDAFTGEGCRGNPAAVYLLKTPQSESWMQEVAAEFNLSETAFLVRRATDVWDLRWFTPTCEVNLCGHATLASAHVLANELQIPIEQFRFSTKSGELRATKIGSDIELDFPRTFTTPAKDAENVKDIIQEATYIYKAGEDWLVEFPNEAAVIHYRPDFTQLSRIPCRGIIVTAQSTSADFVSRFFGPNAGINEDPVTGSAHCALADYWSKKITKHHFTAWQASQRGGYLQLTLTESRVMLRGKSTTRMRGEFIG